MHHIYKTMQVCLGKLGFKHQTFGWPAMNYSGLTKHGLYSAIIQNTHLAWQLYYLVLVLVSQSENEDPEKYCPKIVKLTYCSVHSVFFPTRRLLHNVGERRRETSAIN